MTADDVTLTEVEREVVCICPAHKPWKHMLACDRHLSAVARILADRLAAGQAELEFSRQTTTNVMEALAASGAETAAAEAERDALAAAYASAPSCEAQGTCRALLDLSAEQQAEEDRANESAERRLAEVEAALDALVDRLCDCGDFDGHPGDCAATPVINLCAALANPPAEEVEERCTTPGCPGDWRYAAPGRSHVEGCRYPLPPAQHDAEVGALTVCDQEHGHEGNPARVYGHHGSQRTCIRLKATNQWAYDPAWEARDE